MTDKSDGVVIVSGGLDSVTTVYYMMQVHNAHPHLISFDYGQRHIREIEFAQACAERLGLRWSLVDLSSVTELIDSSALTWGADVPEGHYAADNMAITVVPNRNMMMLAIAGAVATSRGYKYLAAGMHAGDHAQYPDCRPSFFSSMTAALRIGNEGFMDPNFELLTPFVYQTKNDIARQAYTLGVPLDQTWSCYKGGAVHCGRCGTCVERLEAIASVTDAPEDWDKTEYADTEFWKTEVAKFAAAGKE